MKNVLKFLKSFLWVAPFLSFIFGYFFVFSFFHTNYVFVPNVIGKKLQHAMKDAAKTGLFVRIIREKEDSELEPGTVVEQSPRVGKKSKPNQTIFVTLSKLPGGTVIPVFLGRTYDSTLLEMKKFGSRATAFWLSSFYPKNLCIAQTPGEGSELSEGSLALYFSSGKSNLFVFPDFRGGNAIEVKNRLEGHGVKVEVIHAGRLWKIKDFNGDDYIDCKVVDQEPTPGAIVDKSKKIYVQLQVR